MTKRKIISIKNSFGSAVRLKAATFGYFMVWEQTHSINFWDKGSGSCVGDLQFTPDTFEAEAEQVFLQLKAEGIDFIRLNGRHDPVKDDDAFRLYIRPEAVQYFEDNLYEGVPAITVAQAPFYLGEEERADFKHELMSKTPKDDWLEFSADLSTQFQCANGYYGFRKSMVIDMFANARDGLLAIQTPDKFRSFVPVKNPGAIIDAVARELPQLVKSDGPANAYPLYYDPAIYPPGKRRHMNIIMRR